MQSQPMAKQRTQRFLRKGVDLHATKEGGIPAFRFTVFAKELVSLGAIFEFVLQIKISRKSPR